ncbi:hypothetical protein J6590_053074, partial [Homalodisca vitripennis]
VMFAISDVIISRLCINQLAKRSAVCIVELGTGMEHQVKERFSGYVCFVVVTMLLKFVAFGGRYRINITA